MPVVSEDVGSEVVVPEDDCSPPEDGDGDDEEKPNRPELEAADATLETVETTFVAAFTAAKTHRLVPGIPVLVSSPVPVKLEGGPCVRRVPVIVCVRCVSVVDEFVNSVKEFSLSVLS